jgi:hypothetical protein
VPAFTLAGVVVAQLLTFVADRARRRADRAVRLDPEKINFYRLYVHACYRLLDLPVWPESRTEPVTPTRPLTEDIRRIDIDIAFSAPAVVTATAYGATTWAVELARAIEEIRESSTRPTGGALTGPDAERHATAHRALTEAIHDFIREARRDVGVTAPYLKPAPSR